MKSTILTKELDNGLKIIGELRDEAGCCTVGFCVNTGARDETPEEAGLSHFLEHMVFKGTAKRNAKEVNDRFGEIGAKVNAYTSEENTVYYGTILPEHQNDMLEVLADMLRPALDFDEFSMEKKVIIEEIALKYDDPATFFIMDTFGKYFKNHPLGNSILGTAESVTAITLEQMKDYHRRRYSPRNMALVIAGKFNWEEFCNYAEEYCSAWENLDSKRDRPEFSFYKEEKTYYRKNINTTHLLFLAPCPTAQSEDRFAAVIWSMMMGDAVGSRLYWDLIDTGFAESIYAWVDDKDRFGRQVFYTSCSEENIEKASDSIRNILNKPACFEEAELDRAKTKLASRIAIGAEMSYGRMVALGESWLYRQNLISVEETIDRVKSIGVEDLVLYTQKYPLSNFGEFRLLAER